MPTAQALTITGFDLNAIKDTSFSDKAVANVRLGRRVDRAAAALPQSTVGSLFTITGVVEIHRIWGKVGTAIQNQANNTKLQAKATGQTAVDLCAVLDVANKATNILLTITGTAATAMQAGYAAVAQSTPWVVQDGTIDLNCAASNTGTVAWSCEWVPLTDGATVVAA